MDKLPEILVVDDELMLLVDLQVTLEKEGMVVHEAANALAAFEILQRHPDIDLVITDIQMPGAGNGMELAHFVRRMKPSVPIIILSGHAPEADAELPAEALVLSKPIKMETLVEAVHGALRQAV